MPSSCLDARAAGGPRALDLSIVVANQDATTRARRGVKRSCNLLGEEESVKRDEIKKLMQGPVAGGSERRDPA